MPTYNLRFTDTTKDPIVVFPKSLDGPGANRINTDLRLYGQGSELWGEGMAEDLLRLLENFASPATGSPPGPANLVSPIEGQIWFNQTDDSAYVYRPLGTPQWQRMAQDGESYTVAEIDAGFYTKIVADGLFVDVAGDIMTGNLTISKSSPLLILNSTDNTDSRLDFQENGVTIGDVGFSAPGNDITLQRRGGVGSPVAAVTEAISLTSGTGQINVPFKLNAGDPVVDADAARKRYVDDTIAAAVAALSSIPPGTMTAYGGTTAPTGWLLCDGGSKTRTTYPDLFAIISTIYGSVNASSFNVPDMRGRVAVALDGGINRIPTGADNLGNSLGASTHTLTSSQMPVHKHTASSANNGGHTHKIKALLKSTEGDSPDYSFQHVGFAGSTNKSGFVVSEPDHKHTITVNNTGSGSSHNNLQPTLAVNWIIRT